MINEFNLLASTSRGCETYARSELRFLFEKIGDTSPVIERTGISGLIAVKTNMDAIEAIRGRQSAGAMTSDEIPRAVIEQLLAAAVQAPNHYKVRPWRFVVVTGKGRNKLGDVMAEGLRHRFPGLDNAALNRERAKPLRAPVIIAVGVDAPTESKVLDVENICAAAAACENLLLAAFALGLGAKWRTGDAARDPEVKSFLGFGPDRPVIAFLYLGYPEVWAALHERPGFEERTTWIE